MNRRILSVGLLGLCWGLLPVNTVEACSRCNQGGGGRTYHYNGAGGYWTGGPATPALLTPVATAPSTSFAQPMMSMSPANTRPRSRRFH